MSPTKKLWVEIVIGMIFVISGAIVMGEGVDGFGKDQHWTNIVKFILGFLTLYIGSGLVQNAWKKL